MRLAALGGVLLCLAACASEPTSVASGAPSNPPTTSPTPGPFAVMVHTAGGNEPYFVTMVPLDGVGGAWAQATTRTLKEYYYAPTPCPPGTMCVSSSTANYHLPEISISRTHVYFLDGDTQINSLAPDGIIQAVMRIPAPPNSQVTFAVSPDDKRIAVSVITLATTNLAAAFNGVMYVEDLGPGSHRVDLYSSTTLAEWPVGWHAGNIVVAVAPDIAVNIDNPYAGTGYRTVDPSTGQALASLDCTSGLLSAAGTACASGWCANPVYCGGAAALGKQEWNGVKTSWALPAGGTPKVQIASNYSAQLSPDGMRIAAEVVSDPQTGARDTVDLVADGLVSIVARSFSPEGWLDNGHLVASSAAGVWIIEVDRGGMIQMSGLRRIALQGEPRLAGVLPANL